MGGKKITVELVIDSGSKKLDDKIEEWLAWDKNESSRNEIISLICTKKVEHLSKLLLSRLEFGTAGLRGRMGSGYSQMNDLVIIQTSQGFASYLLYVNPNVKKQGVVIGYDGRYNSQRWAKLTAAIFLNENIPVYLFSTVCPTPFVPFTILQFKCAAGIMVTASHNPKDDNGYKVYWANGAQIIPPHDSGIQESILRNLTPLKTSWDISITEKSTCCIDPLPTVMKTYYDPLRKNVLFPNVNVNTPLKFTYTSLHGVGYNYMVEAFKVTNFNPFIVVEEQKDPDPEFPTVKFPNPEEGKSTLDLSIKTADAHSSTVILANDPDADRLAVAEKQKSGKWLIFSGNELGTLLGWWSLFCYKERHPKANMSDVYMIASTVSSKMLRSVAKAEGFNFVETLTGFKWMGNKACDLMNNGKTVLFAFEEAIGFMNGTAVLDKDGISAAVKCAEMAAYLETQKMTLSDKLADLFKMYGYHISKNSYFLCYDAAVIKKIFERLRRFDGAPNSYPPSIMNGKYKIVDVRDLTTGYDTSQPDKRAVLPVSESTQMVTFSFGNGLVATLRTSGTEPKIKYYTELCGSPGQEVEVLRKTLDEMVAALVEEFLQPKLNNLGARGE